MTDTIRERLANSGLTGGPVSSYLIDAGLISPNEAQIEAIEFHVDVDTDGTILDQSESVRVQPGYTFLMSALYGAASWGATQDTDIDKLHLVSFNVLNEGRNKSVFRRPIPMNTLVCPGGPAHELEFRSIFRFFESADISVDWFVDPAYGTPAADEPKRFTALLIGDIINVEALPKVSR
jgi:hypothetical protein